MTCTLEAQAKATQSLPVSMQSPHVPAGDRISAALKQLKAPLELQHANRVQTDVLLQQKLMGLTADKSQEPDNLHPRVLEKIYVYKM